jgi:prevent-host-death family protein
VTSSLLLWSQVREVGVRELKRTLSQTLRRVGSGEQVRVTLRGRPIADIVPAGPAAADPVRALAAEGRLALPARGRPRRAPRLARGRLSASTLVLEERSVER